MLSRVEDFNEKIKKERMKNGESWDWRDHYVLLGSDVKALFPSLSADNTSKIIRKQAEKIQMNWKM